jgi:GAF domain-containing protein
VLGAIEVEPSEPMREGDTLEMMRSVAERLATTLENTRLLEQSQADTAQKERVNEIIAQFQTVTTIDELLRLSLTQLSQTLGAERSSVRIAMLRTPALTEATSNGSHDAAENRED